MLTDFLLLLVTFVLFCVYIFILYIKLKKRENLNDKILLEALSNFFEKEKMEVKEDETAVGRFLFIVKTRQVYYAPRGRILSEVYVEYLFKENIEEENLDVLLSCLSAHNEAMAWKKNNDVLVIVSVDDYDVYETALRLLLRKGKFKVLEDSKGEALKSEIMYGGERYF